MKKYQKIFFIGLLLSGFVFSAAGCSLFQTSFVPPEPGGGNVIINDAYDWNEDGTGSTRPDLDDDYVPIVPPTVVTVTLAGDSGIKFKDGENSITIPVGVNLKPTDFDESTLGGREIAGVAILNDEGGVRAFAALDKFNPSSSVTVAPYFDPERGVSLSFGSDNVASPYYDENGKDVSKNPEYAVRNDLTLINGYIGNKISCTHALGTGAYFRTLSRYDVDANSTYVYRYTYKNFGDRPIKFNTYQMYTGADWANSKTSISMGLTELQPGEMKTVSVKIRMTSSNNNAISVTRIAGDTEGFMLGVVLTAENVTVTPGAATIDFDLPEGFAVADSYAREVRTNDKLKLPAAEQISNNTGHNLLGWVYANSNRTPAVAGTPIRGNITLQPLLSEDAKIEFVDMPAGFSVKSAYITQLQMGDLFKLPAENQIENNTGRRLLYWEYEEGGRIVDGYSLTESVLKIRPVFAENVEITLDLPEGVTVSDEFNTKQQKESKLVLPTDGQVANTSRHKITGWVDGKGNKVDKNTVLTGDITIRPLMTEDAVVTLELPSGVTVADEYNRVMQFGDKLILPTAGQITNTTKSNVLYWVDADGNRVDENTVFNGNITIKPVMSQVVTITLELPENFAVNSDYETIVESGEKLVLPTAGQITNDTGHNLLGWADGASQPVTDETIVIANITIRPILSQTANITVLLPDGLTLSSEYVTTAETQDKLVTPSAAQVTGEIPNGRTVEGWYIVGGTGDNVEATSTNVIDENTVVGNTRITIAPYFSRMNGTATLSGFTDENSGKPLVFGNENPPGNMSNNDGTVTFVGSPVREYKNWVAVGGGDGGYSELGSVFGFDGKFKKGGKFRTSTVVGQPNIAGSEIVEPKVNHTFYINLENFGKTALDFKIQGVNSGSDVEGPVTDVQLAPGASTRISFTVNYTKGSKNRNVMLFFTFNEAVENMRIGVALNVVLDSDKQQIEPEGAGNAQTAVAANTEKLTENKTNG